MLCIPQKGNDTTYYFFLQVKSSFFQKYYPQTYLHARPEVQNSKVAGTCSIWSDRLMRLSLAYWANFRRFVVQILEVYNYAV